MPPKSGHYLVAATIDSCCNLGRRALADFLGMVERNESSVLQEMLFLISRRRSGIEPQKLRERAVSAVVALCELGSYGIVIRISNALGSGDLSSTYDRIFPNRIEPIMKLVYLSLQLDHYDNFPETTVRQESTMLYANPFAFRVLRSLVVRYLTLFPTDFRLKQHLSDVLKLNFQHAYSPKGDQLLIEG